MSLLNVHPVARATGRRNGHSLRVRRATDYVGQVGTCSCRGWGTWKHTRRQVVRAFHAHLAHICLADMRRAA